jgi:hypothetical protein
VSTEIAFKFSVEWEMNEGRVIRKKRERRLKCGRRSHSTLRVLAMAATVTLDSSSGETEATARTVVRFRSEARRVTGMSRIQRKDANSAELQQLSCDPDDPDVRV